MQLPAPQSQKAGERPISFVLDDGGAAPVRSVSLAIRPEDLTRADSSRMSVQQTLGGAWADNFGPGLASITISGHTGWSRRLVANDQRDGMERFAELYETVFKQWHTLRNDAVLRGENPDKVRLIFADALDKMAAVVALNGFTLKRSKSRPLLCQYQISMTVLTEDLGVGLSALPGFGTAAGVLDKKARESLGLDSLTDSIASLTNLLGAVQEFVDRALVDPAREFLKQTVRLYEHVRTAIRTADEIAGSLIGVARMTAAAGMNIFRTIGAITSLPDQARARLMNVASEYGNIFCVLRNALSLQQYVPDYNPLFGSSHCSSTSGGRPVSPLSGVNPFYLYSPSNRTLPVSIASAAQAGLQTMAEADVVLSPMSGTALAGVMSQIIGGLSVTA